MHETFHKDPTDVSKRRPRRLRGTPANKWSLALSGGLAAIFGLACQLFVDSKWSEPMKKKFAELATPTEEQILQKLAMTSIFYNSSITNLRRKDIGELKIGPIPVPNK